MTDNEKIQTVLEIIEKNPVCMFTTQDDEKTLLSRPMTVAKVEDNGELWFFSSSKGVLVDDPEAETEVNLSFSGGGQWLSIHGTAVVIHSEPKAQELWNEAVAVFYPDGPTSPDLLLLRVRPAGAHYWKTPGGAITIIFQWAKARLTGDTINAGESHSVELQDPISTPPLSTTTPRIAETNVSLSPELATAHASQDSPEQYDRKEASAGHPGAHRFSTPDTVPEASVGFPDAALEGGEGQHWSPQERENHPPLS